MKFVPIDHKDSSPEYRELVWKSVAKEIGHDLIPVESISRIAGKWQFTDASFTWTFLVPGLLMIEFANGKSEVQEVNVIPGRLLRKTQDFHLAFSESGSLVVFNGDGSLLLIGNRIDGTARP